MLTLDGTIYSVQVEENPNSTWKYQATSDDVPALFVIRGSLKDLMEAIPENLRHALKVPENERKLVQGYVSPRLLAEFEARTAELNDDKRRFYD